MEFRIMTGRARRIEFEGFADNIRQVFDDMRQHDDTVEVVCGPDLYRTEREALPADIFATCDAERAARALRAGAGALKRVDRDALLGEPGAARTEEQRASLTIGKQGAPPQHPDAARQGPELCVSK